MPAYSAEQARRDLESSIDNQFSKSTEQVPRPQTSPVLANPQATNHSLRNVEN